LVTYQLSMFGDVGLGVICRVPWRRDGYISKWPWNV